MCMCICVTSTYTWLLVCVYACIHFKWTQPATTLNFQGCAQCSMFGRGEVCWRGTCQRTRVCFGNLSILPCLVGVPPRLCFGRFGHCEVSFKCWGDRIRSAKHCQTLPDRKICLGLEPLGKTKRRDVGLHQIHESCSWQAGANWSSDGGNPRTNWMLESVSRFVSDSWATF